MKIGTDKPTRAERFDIDLPGDKRMDESTDKELAMFGEHTAERAQRRLRNGTDEWLYSGRYFTEKQQHAWTVRGGVRNGRDVLCDQRGYVIDRSGETMNFVIISDPKRAVSRGERLIVTPEQKSSHGQMAGGKPVKYAGEMEIEGGRIVHANFSAGHYRQPSAQKAQKWREAIPRIARAEVAHEHPLRNRLARVFRLDFIGLGLSKRYEAAKAKLDGDYDAVKARAETFERYLGVKLSRYSEQSRPEGDDVSTTSLHPAPEAVLKGPSG